MTSPNGVRADAISPGLDSGSPFGGPGVGAVAPPPPLNALGSDVADLRHELGLISQAVLQLQDQKPVAQPKAKREAPQWLTKVRQLPTRSVVVLCVGGAVAATAFGVNRFTPQRYDAAQIAAIAADQASKSSAAALRGEINSARAQATQVLVPDPFAAYGRELTEDSKTAIGYDSSTGGKSLNPARSLVVANQVKEALSQRSMTLDEMRLSSIGPTQLRVHNNPAEGYQLFAPPAVRAPDSMTATTVATATSAP